MIQFNNLHTQTQNSLSAAVFDYYTNKQQDRNLIQATDGYVHHHFGLGPLEISETETDQDKIIVEIQRQENKLTSHIISLLQITDGISDSQKILDAGCGRGGTMFRIADQYASVSIDGVNLTEYQTEFCKERILERDLKNRVEVRQANFLSLPYPDNSFTHAYCCEVTQYALDLAPLISEINRTLQPGGRFVIATWCINDNKSTPRLNELVEPINDHYASTMHGINEYLSAIKAGGLQVDTVEDRTVDLIPYWELRTRWELKSGIEENFIKGHKENDLNYYFIVATKPL